MFLWGVKLNQIKLNYVHVNILYVYVEKDPI